MTCIVGEDPTTYNITNCSGEISEVKIIIKEDKGFP